jgi:Cdc6-like AAA superfamily ATPase
VGQGLHQAPIFWLNGLTGTGKSAIAQTVADRCDAYGRLGSSVFCSRDVNSHNNLRSIFPTLAIQLAQKDPEVRSILVPLLRSNPDVVYESPSDQVEKLIVKPLKSRNVPAVIVIDTLDEWTNGTSQSAILSAVEHWVEEIPRLNSS